MKNQPSNIKFLVPEQPSEFPLRTIKDGSQVSGEQQEISLPNNFTAVALVSPEWHPDIQLNISWIPPEGKIFLEILCNIMKQNLILI